MKLLCCYYTHKPGGFCKRLYRLMNALAARGHDVNFCALDKPPATLSESVHYHRIPFPFAARKGLLFWALFTFWCPVYLAFYSRKFAPDKYFVFGAYYSGMLRLSRVFHPRPLILFLRSLVFRIDEINDKPRALRLISNLVDRIGILSASSVVCMTKTMQDELEHFFEIELPQAAILPNDAPPPSANQEMVDESSLKIFERLNERLSAARLVVLTSGVIDRRKNIEYVLNAFESLQKSGKGGDAMLLVAGDGPLLKQFRADAATRKIPSIEFLGWCDSLEPLYPFVDLVVHPALHEGVPNSVLEALAAGIPVLCANTPEMREILGAEELLFNPADPQELTGHLTKILTEPSNHLRTLSEVSGKASERLKFDWDEKASSLVASS